MRGDVFGGWIMSLMDMAGKVSATTAANGRVVTVAVERIVFRAPADVGDVVRCYAHVRRARRSSIALSFEVWTSARGRCAAQGHRSHLHFRSDRRHRASAANRQPGCGLVVVTAVVASVDLAPVFLLTGRAIGCQDDRERSNCPCRRQAQAWRKCIHER
jgi:hypothetical protein